jgi:ATP-dependent helicase HrpA
VSLRVLGTPEEARDATRAGVRRLLALTISSPVKHVVGRLPNTDKLALAHNPYGSVPALLEDCVDAALDLLVDRHGGVPADRAAFDTLRERVRADLPETAYDVVRATATVLALAHDVTTRVSGAASPAVAATWDDVRSQVTALVRPGFVTAAGAERLRDLARYLTAVQRRLDALPGSSVRDAESTARVAAVTKEHDAWLAAMRPARRRDPAVRAVRWMLEELRVSLFAQQLGTAYPVSEQRIYRAMDALDG